MQSAFAYEGGNKVYVNLEYKQIIDHIWEKRRQNLTDLMKNRLEHGDVYVLYDMQTFTNNLLRYSFYTGQYSILNDLIRIYSIAYGYIKVDKDNYKKWIFTNSASMIAKDNPNLLNKEVPLCSAQFLYLISSAINIIVQLNTEARTEEMYKFVADFTPLIVKDHYLRWIHDISPAFNKKIKERKVKHDFTNAVTDKELWLTAGVVEILSANNKNPDIIHIEPQDKEILMKFVKDGIKLIRTRITQTQLKDFNGNNVSGALFDRGSWDNYEDYAYSGYTGVAYPANGDKIKAKNVGWDISHARRFVHVFDTLYNNRTLYQDNFPDKQLMTKFANQITYGIFNRDFDQSLFTNYIDGTNGWYRVGYKGRENFGYGPFMLSQSIPEGGYGFWARYNRDICKILNSLWLQIKKDRLPYLNGNESTLQPSFTVKYYGKGYYNLNDDSLELLQFLPSMCNCDMSSLTPNN